MAFSGTFKSFVFLMKSFVSFMYDGIFFTIGWRWQSTYREIFDVWQSNELITGRNTQIELGCSGITST